MKGRTRVALTLAIGLLACAVAAPATAASTDPAHATRKCKRKHRHHRKRCLRRHRALLSISPAGHDFGTIGTANSAPFDFVITNTGGAPSGLPVAYLSGTGTSNFQINATTCTSSLAPAASCTVTVQSVDNTGATAVAQLNMAAAPGGAASAALIVNLF